MSYITRTTVAGPVVHSETWGQDHDYEPGDTTHPMRTDPDCRICGGRRH